MANRLESIEFTTYPDVRLHCNNGVVFDASMNDNNRERFDAMDDFPELIIEDYNTSRGLLKSGNIAVYVFLQRLM